MPFVTSADKTEIYYNDWGSGKPVVLVHGWPLNADMWEHQAEALLQAGHRVVSYDRRGFGRSSKPLGGHDYDTLADDLATLVDTLDLNGAALVGFSMGGGEVVRYLSRHGETRVAKAALVSAVTPYMLHTEDNPDGVPQQQFDAFRAAILEDRFAFLNTFGPLFYGRTLINHTVSEPVLDWTFAMAIQANLRATLDDITAFGTTDFRREMKTLTTPFLVVHGTADTTAPIDATGRAAAAILRNAKLVEYDGQPHGLFMTEPDRLSADLVDFLAGP